jgi:large subunit ribosomal protein L3
MGFGPRKRASSETPRFNSWPDDDGAPSVQGFAGYKAGMTHVVRVNDESESPRAGMEETVPVTVVATPPVRVAALRAYESTPYGHHPTVEVWADDQHDDLAVEGDGDTVDDLRNAVDDGGVDDLRAITHPVPREVSGVPETEPPVMETRIGGGSVADRVDHAVDLLGDDYAVTDVFRAGEYADVAGVTTGKGLQGPVKRWGVQKRKGKHYRQGWRRRIGNLGPWNPSRVRSTVPQQGQTGYHQRTELNKRVLAMGDASDADDDVTPDGGFVNFGEIDGPYALVKGSVPGPKKRLVRLRPAVRPTDQPRLDPEVRYVSTTSSQG